MATKLLAVSFLLSALMTAQTADPKLRAASAREAAKQGIDGIPLLVTLASDASAEVRLEAARQLNTIGGPRTLPALSILANDADPEVQLNAIDGLINIFVPGYLKSGVARATTRSADGVKVKFNDPGNLVVDGYVTVAPEAIAAVTQALKASKNLAVRANAARALGIFGDSVTTDHISPAGAIKKASPAGKFLLENSVEFADFNSYGSRRGNDRIMTRGTFANVRIKNLMLGGEEGGNTIGADGQKTSIYDAAVAYQAKGTPLIVIAGQEYGTGSSRDWAAKGTNLLGVKVVVAQSFERIHRSNLVGMGVLPLQFKDGTTAQTLKLDGTETYDIVGLDANLKPQQDLTLKVTRKDGSVENVSVRCRIDTPIEIEYYQHGGILPYVLRQLVAKA